MLFTIDQIQVLLPDSSRNTAQKAAKIMIEYPENIPNMLSLAFQNSGMLSTRAANVIDKTNDIHPDLIAPFVIEIIKKLSDLKIDGNKRCLLRTVKNYVQTIDEDMVSDLYDYCVNTALKPEEKIAIKNFCIEILEQCMVRYPELKPEINTILEQIIFNTQSVGLKRKVKIIINKE